MPPGTPSSPGSLSPTTKPGFVAARIASIRSRDDAQAVLERPTVLVVALVRPCRHELVEQVAVAGRDLDAGEAAALEPRARLREVVDHPADLVRGQHVRHGPAQVVVQRRDADGDRVAAALVPAAPGILDLAEQPAVLRLDRVGPALQRLDPSSAGASVNQGTAAAMAAEFAAMMAPPTKLATAAKFSANAGSAS
jgi:hypothetical protein